MDGYDIYVQWCRERHIPPPTRQWWDKACAANTLMARARRKTEAELDNAELTRANREDWYGNR